MVIVVDSREQRPYEYPGAITKALASGDYSIAGLEASVAVERKSKADAYNSLGYGRDRFRREVERLAGYDFAAIVVEDSVPSFLHPPPHSRMRPQSALGSLIAWSVRYRVPVLFAGDREHGQALTRKLLEMYWKYRGGKVSNERTGT